ncbi:hypothetical protein Nepgr_015017 [Nepenthes gracilis]|uniref:Uncharacterized protein n=1 Tax=Nepenthes gracilis TaxID=150966 RepID=A0AAD3SMB3_NEPGR|nr:hypothetical protein Nepgr_015017 [Nepenthes gracilis]
MVQTVFSENQQRRKNMEEEDQTTIHLLPHESHEPHFDCCIAGTARELDAEVAPGDSSVTTVLVLSTVIPICGSLNYGLAALDHLHSSVFFDCLLKIKMRLFGKSLALKELGVSSDEGIAKPT